MPNFTTQPSAHQYGCLHAQLARGHYDDQLWALRIARQVCLHMATQADNACPSIPSGAGCVPICPHAYSAPVLWRCDHGMQTPAHGPCSLALPLLVCRKARQGDAALSSTCTGKAICMHLQVIGEGLRRVAQARQQRQQVRQRLAGAGARLDDCVRAAAQHGCRAPLHLCTRNDVALPGELHRHRTTCMCCHDLLTLRVCAMSAWSQYPLEQALVTSEHYCCPMGRTETRGR